MARNFVRRRGACAPAQVGRPPDGLAPCQPQARQLRSARADRATRLYQRFRRPKSRDVTRTKASHNVHPSLHVSVSTTAPPSVANDSNLLYDMSYKPRLLDQSAIRFACATRATAPSSNMSPGSGATSSSTDGGGSACAGRARWPLSPGGEPALWQRPSCRRSAPPASQGRGPTHAS